MIGTKVDFISIFRKAWCCHHHTSIVHKDIKPFIIGQYLVSCPLN